MVELKHRPDLYTCSTEVISRILWLEQRGMSQQNGGQIEAQH